MNNAVRKITISALIIALTVIFMKVLAINPGFSFVRVSFGPALIIFSSLYLGPVYGAIVGAGSDLLGAFVFPTGEYQPLFTLVYGLLGVLPWFLNYVLKIVKNRRFAAIFFNFLLILWAISVMLVVWIFPQINELSTKVIYSSVGLVLTIGSLIGIYFISKHFRAKFPDYDDKFYRYATICLITEILVMVALNSAVKSFHFGVSYLLVVEWMALISFLNIVINTFGSYYLEVLVSKITQK